MIGRDGWHRLLDVDDRAGGRGPVSSLTTGNISFRVETDAVDDLVAEIEQGIEATAESGHAGDRASARPSSGARRPDAVRWCTPRHTSGAARVDGARRRRVRSPDRVTLGDEHLFAIEGGDMFSITVDTGGRVQDPGGLIEGAVGRAVTTRTWAGSNASSPSPPETRSGPGSRPGPDRLVHRSHHRRSMRRSRISGRARDARRRPPACLRRRLPWSGTALRWNRRSGAPTGSPWRHRSRRSTRGPRRHRSPR